MGFHSYTFFTILSFGILYTSPSQPNLCFDVVDYSSIFNQFVQLVICFNPPCTISSLVGPKILLNIFLSNTNSLCFMDSSRTHIYASVCYHWPHRCPVYSKLRILGQQFTFK
jgi:hypothetical protein